jgi:hypothetical protein
MTEPFMTLKTPSKGKDGERYLCPVHYRNPTNHIGHHAGGGKFVLYRKGFLGFDGIWPIFLKMRVQWCRVWSTDMTSDNKTTTPPRIYCISHFVFLSAIENARQVARRFLVNTDTRQYGLNGAKPENGGLLQSHGIPKDGLIAVIV